MDLSFSNYAPSGYVSVPRWANDDGGTRLLHEGRLQPAGVSAAAGSRALSSNNMPGNGSIVAQLQRAHHLFAAAVPLPPGGRDAVGEHHVKQRGQRPGSQEDPAGGATAAASGSGRPSAVREPLLRNWH